MEMLHSILFGDNSLNVEATGNISRIKIDVVTDTLDNFVSKNLDTNLKIDLIKLDTESTEHLVLEGGSNVLQNHRPIIMCEVIKGFTEKEIEKIISKYNYKFFEVVNNGLKLVNSLVVEKGKNDYFFVPEEKLPLIKDLLVK